MRLGTLPHPTVSTDPSPRPQGTAECGAATPDQRRGPRQVVTSQRMGAPLSLRSQQCS